MEVAEAIAAHRDLAKLFDELAQRLRASSRSISSIWSCTIPREASCVLHLLVVPEPTTISAGLELPY